MSNDHVPEPFRSLLNDLTRSHRAAHEELREGMAALNRVNRQTMSNDPHGMTAEEERETQIDEQVERLLAENDRLQSLIVDLQETLDEAINYLAVWAVSNKNYGASALLDKCTAVLANSRGTT